MFSIKVSYLYLSPIVAITMTVGYIHIRCVLNVYLYIIDRNRKRLRPMRIFCFSYLRLKKTSD
jgi:hypothetical protein